MPSSGVRLRLWLVSHAGLPALLPNLGKRREEDKLCFLSLAGKRQLLVAGAQGPGVTECLVEGNKTGKQLEANRD